MSDNATLTIAAELLGEVTERAAEAVSVLRRLACYESPLVREGAVYGLAMHAARDGVADLLRQIAKTDTSAGVREAAAEAIEDGPISPRELSGSMDGAGPA